MILMSKTYDNIQIEQKKLNRMRFKIYTLETKNVKTRKYVHREMVEEIHKIMVEEMNKKL